MSDTLRVQISSTFIQEIPPSTLQMMNVLQDQVPVSYNHGTQRLNASVTDFQLEADANLCILSSSTEFDVKVGSTTNPALRTKIFAYNGTKTNFYISNPSSAAPIDIKFVTSSI